MVFWKQYLSDYTYTWDQLLQAFGRFWMGRLVA